MIVYAESSAVLAWLLGEVAGPQVVEIIDGARQVISSDLTLVECDRAVHRSTALGIISDAAAANIAARFVAVTSNWTILRLSSSVVVRARQRFPHEPVRSLDALHVAWAAQAQTTYSDLALLTLDDRIRRVGATLGFTLLPD